MLKKNKFYYVFCILFWFVGTTMSWAAIEGSDQTAEVVPPLPPALVATQGPSTDQTLKEVGADAPKLPAETSVQEEVENEVPKETQAELEPKAHEEPETLTTFAGEQPSKTVEAPESDQTAENTKVDTKESQPKNQTEESSTSVNALFGAESLKVCSMGHNNHKVEKFKYIKRQEFNGQVRKVKYSAQEKPQFGCQLSLENKERDIVYLSCWKGAYEKVKLSRFLLAYYYKSDYLFVNKMSGKMVMLMTNPEDKPCVKKFRPVVKKKVRVLKTRDTGPGLADLTF